MTRTMTHTLAALCALAALASAGHAQTARIYDDFSGPRLDPQRWEHVALLGGAPARATLDKGVLTLKGGAPETRSGIATRARLGERFAVEAEARGYEGINQILMVYGGEGDFAHHVEFGIEGTEKDGTPILHVWPFAGPVWEGPAPQRGPYGPDRPLRLRIERDGTTYRFYANGQKVHTLTSDGVGPEPRIVLYGFGESESQWANVRLSGPDVMITAPEPGQTVKGGLEVSGAVSGAVRWGLYDAAGTYPLRWNALRTGQGDVRGRLDLWRPTPNSAGPFTLRLLGVGEDGASRSYWTVVNVDRATIHQPRPGQIVGPAFTVALDGSLGDVARARFYDNGHLKAERTGPPFHARLTPSQDGPHALTVELTAPNGETTTLGPVNVTVQRDLYGRNARVADHGRAFVFPDGSVGPIIGQNDSYTWDGLAPLWKDNDAEKVAAYLRTQRSSGVNVLRIMLEGIVPPPEDILERPLGTYSESVVRFWDRFLALCERHGMTVLITPWDTFWMNQPWSVNPYNKANGGPCETQADFIRSPEARRWQKERLKFLIDRYGNSPAIFAIDLLNEFDIWWTPASPRERADWVEEMAAFTRDYQLKKWGHAHMLTVSSAAAEPGGIIGEVVYRHPLFEFANTHLYYGGTVNNPKDLTGPARSVNHGVRYALDQFRDGRPYTDSESGAIDLHAPWLTGDGAFDDEVFRAMSWAHLASGGAGGGMRWPYRVPHVLSAGMNRSQLSIAQVASHLDWRTFQPENADRRAALNRPGFLTMASADRRQAIAWIMREDSPLKGAATERKPPVADLRLTLSGLDDGRYTVTCWDATTGFPIKRETLTAAGGAVAVNLPPVALDLAITFRRTP